jgi:hypothetical protein
MAFAHHAVLGFFPVRLRPLLFLAGHFQLLSEELLLEVVQVLFEVPSFLDVP